MSVTFGSDFNLVVYLASTTKLKSPPILLFYNKGSVQWKITYAYYCLDMFIWPYCAQNNIFNNIIMMNFRDI